MPTLAPLTLAIRRRHGRERIGLGMPGDTNLLLGLARRVTSATGNPVIGGLAVYLHGAKRTTVDLDLYTENRRETAEALEALGARWDAKAKEHVLEGVPIHTLSPEETQHKIERVSTIDQIKVARLADLVAIKLRSGLTNVGRLKDLADVQALIAMVPLDKRFAGKVPPDLRADFKRMVDAVRVQQSHVRTRQRY